MCHFFTKLSEQNFYSQCGQLKSWGFKKAVNWQCQTPAKSCQHLSFCFPGISTDWVPKKSAEKPVQLASNFSLFFSAALKLLLRSFKKPSENSNVLNTNGANSDHVTRKIGPLYFTINNLQSFSSQQWLWTS